MYRSVDQRREFGVRQGPFTGSHVIDVDRLSARDRLELAERLRSTSPILADRTRDELPWALCAFILALVALGWLALLQLGKLGEPWAMQSEWPWPLLYGAVGTIAAGSAARIRLAIRSAGWQALPQGTYLFPLDLLVVSGRRLHVHPFGDARLVAIDEQARSVAITYADGRSIRVTGKRASSASLLAELLSAQSTLEDATLSGSSSVDVLASIRSAGWDTVEATGTPRTDSPFARRALLVVSALAGAALGVGVWYGRERLSDDAMYQAARDLDTSAAYRRYLDRGARHEADARQHGLPRAVSREAGHDIVLLDRFVRDYPPSTEVDHAKATLHEECRTYAASHASTPSAFERRGDAVALPRGVDTCGVGARPGAPGAPTGTLPSDRSEGDICASELASAALALARAALDRALLTHDPVRLWDFIHTYGDPQLVGEARDAARASIDGLVADVRAKAGDAEVEAELVALLELARDSERAAVVGIDDRTSSLVFCNLELPLSGPLRFVDAGPPYILRRAAGSSVRDATWTFTDAGGKNLRIVMVRNQKRIERTFAGHGYPVAPATRTCLPGHRNLGTSEIPTFLRLVARWPMPAERVVY